MFIDYLGLMLANMVAGLLLLCFFYLKGIVGSDGRPWAAGFAATGVVALACGLHMSWTWPLPGSYNVAFGEMASLFGAAYLAVAAALVVRRAEGGPVAAVLLPVGVYTFVAGLAAILVGVCIARLRLTNAPVLSAVGFGLAGLGGVLLPVVARWSRARALRIAAALVVLAAAVLWAAVTYKAFVGHMERFQKYSPPVPQQPSDG